jgi:SAM-dependent methyltransferase
MILPQLLWRFLKYRDDPEFYRMQAADAIRWIGCCGAATDAGAAVLDLGCGHGVFGGELLARGCRVTFADEADHRLPRFADAPFRSVNLDRDPLDDLGRHDLVVCSNVLEHLARPGPFLSRAHALLAPGGRLYLSWTNWLSPWGGHEFSPLHYLGPSLATRIHDARRKPRFHRPGVNLFVTHIGAILRHIDRSSGLRVERRAPRYYTELGFLLHLPVAREFLAWNCALLLRRRDGDD